MPSKFFVVGDVNGQLSSFFSKLKALHAKQSFAFAILLGNLFADQSTISDSQKQEQQDLLDGKIEVPLPTYFALGSRPLPSSVLERLATGEVELCANLSFLGRKVSLETSEGFRVVAIGGAHTSADDVDMDEFTSTYSDKDTLSVQNSKEVDFLITSDWPAEVRDGSKKPYTGDAPTGVTAVSQLCTALKPRFHFTTSPAVYQREGFYHLGMRPHSITRFISLAPYNTEFNAKLKDTHHLKWHFAAEAEPSQSPPDTLPHDYTPSPFVKMASRKRKAVEGSADDSQNGFRFARGDNGYQNRGRGFQKRRRYQPTQESCFFCMAREEAETHMVTSIGKNAYMTIAKGPLSTRTTFPALGHPLHMIIIPFNHKPTVADLPDEEREATFAEMQRYREAIHSMISSKSTNGADGEAQLGAVTWEISRSNQLHVHWQIMPVPIEMVQKRVVEAAFDAEAEISKYPEFVKKASQIGEVEKGDYLKIMIWSESAQKEIVMPLDDSFRFDLQFPRRVMAKLLKLESRMQWRDVAQPKAEEEADVKMFIEMFSEHDFALVEGYGESD